MASLKKNNAYFLIHTHSLTFVISVQGKFEYFLGYVDIFELITVWVKIFEPMSDTVLSHPAIRAYFWYYISLLFTVYQGFFYQNKNWSYATFISERKLNSNLLKTKKCLLIYIWTYIIVFDHLHNCEIFVTASVF